MGGLDEQPSAVEGEVTSDEERLEGNSVEVRVPVSIVTGAKGEGPVRTFFPGLTGRPKIEARHVDHLHDILKKAAAKEHISATPGPGAKPPITMKVYSPASSVNSLPRGVPDGFRDRHELRLRVEPYVEIAPEGKAHLRWETWLNTAPSFVHFGIQIPDQILPYSRYRLGSKTEKLDGKAQVHESILTLSRLEKRIVDVVGFGEAGGTVDYRIEMRDPTSFLIRLLHGRFSYIKSETAYIAGVTISEGPFVDIPTPDGMTISFETDVPTIGAVLVTSPAGKGFVFKGDKSSRHHEIKLTQLEVDTLYSYRVAAIDAREIIGWSGDFAFRTAPEKTRPFRFAVMSDSRGGLGGTDHLVAGSNHTIIKAFTSEAFKLGADLILFPGDLVNGYTTQKRWFEIQLEGWKHAVEPVAHYIPIFEGIGNHELLFDRSKTKRSPRLDKKPPNSTEDIFAAEFVNPRNGPAPEKPGLPPYVENVYSFDYGKTHFVSINTNYWITSGGPGENGNREGFVMEKQMQWLEEDLRKAREDGAGFIFVYTHEPGFPNGGHHGDAMYWRGRIDSVNEMRTQFWKMMSDHKVDVVFHGDEHNYSRLRVDSKMDPSFKNPVWQIITGGCGAPYYAQSKKVPWVDRVEHFSPQEHFVMVDILSDNEGVVSILGRNSELLDRFSIHR